MIYRVDLRYGDVSFELLVDEEHSQDYAYSVFTALRDAGFTAHLAWPDRESSSLTLIIEGESDVGEAIEAIRQAAVRSGHWVPYPSAADPIGELPAELVAANPEDRLTGIAEMAVPKPGKLCARCNVKLPDHEDWCPWRTQGWFRETPGSGGDDEGGGAPRDRRPIEPPEIRTQVTSEDAEKRSIPTPAMG